MAAPTSWVELDKLHILDWQASTGDQSNTITSASVRTSAREIGSAISTVVRNITRLITEQTNTVMLQGQLKLIQLSVQSKQKLPTNNLLDILETSSVYCLQIFS